MTPYPVGLCPKCHQSFFAKRPKPALRFSKTVFCVSATVSLLLLVGETFYRLPTKQPLYLSVSGYPDLGEESEPPGWKEMGVSVAMLATFSTVAWGIVAGRRKCSHCGNVIATN